MCTSVEGGGRERGTSWFQDGNSIRMGEAKAVKGRVKKGCEGGLE